MKINIAKILGVAALTLFFTNAAFAQDVSTFSYRGALDKTSMDLGLSTGTYGIMYQGEQVSLLTVFDAPSTSTGTFQLEAYYWGTLRYRNQIDHNRWSSWNDIWTGTNNQWLKDMDGNQRLYMESAGATLIKGSGTKPIELLAGDNTSLLRFSNEGYASMGGKIVPGYRLAVNGAILTDKVRVMAYNNWPDYVFESNYILPKLQELDAFVKTNKHLPEIPAAADVAKDGVDLGEMNKLLLKKVEELTLYIIEQDKKQAGYDEKFKQLEKELQELKRK